MNNATLFIIIMIMVLTLDYFSRREIQSPENQTSNGSNGQSTEVMINLHSAFHPFWTKLHRVMGMSPASELSFYKE